jgi:multidrug efflux pump subunit AcrA (membrane-fusion protein)
MTFEVDIAGTLRQVTVDPLGVTAEAGGRFRIVVDGDALEVDARRTNLGLSLVLPGGRVVDAALTGGPGGAWLVQLPRITVAATVDGRRFRQAGPGDAGSGEQRITAPMPGRVLRVLVKPGDHVAVRQGLVVVEAMKMENELTAARPGRVRDVVVAEGASVESGRLLLVIE